MTPPTAEFAPLTTDAAFAPLSTNATFALGDDRITMVDNTLTLTAGDTHEPVRAQLFDPEGEPVDLSEARRVRFLLLNPSGTELINRTAQVDNSTDEPGWVRYEWGRGETDTPGTHKAWFVVDYSDGTEQHYPNDDTQYLRIRQE